MSILKSIHREIGGGEGSEDYARRLAEAAARRCPVVRRKPDLDPDIEAEIDALIAEHGDARPRGAGGRLRALGVAATRRGAAPGAWPAMRNEPPRRHQSRRSRRAWRGSATCSCKPRGSVRFADLTNHGRLAPLATLARKMAAVRVAHSRPEIRPRRVLRAGQPALSNSAST